MEIIFKLAASFLLISLAMALFMQLVVNGCRMPQDARNQHLARHINKLFIHASSSLAIFLILLATRGFNG